MLLDAHAADIIHTPVVSGIPASFLRQSLEQAGYDMNTLTGGQVQGKLKPIDDETKAWKTVWSAGQGVGAIHDLPSASALIERLHGEYRQALERCQVLRARAL